MATAKPTLEPRGDNAIVHSWSLTSTNVDGAPIGEDASAFADRTLQVTGTWGGATCVVQGSNDGSTWFSLNDIFGASIALTANGLVSIAEAPLFVRPYLSVAGSGATLTALMVSRKLVV